MTRAVNAERPDPVRPAPSRPLSKAERAAREARKREILERRKAAGYGAPGGSHTTITK